MPKNTGKSSDKKKSDEKSSSNIKSEEKIDNVKDKKNKMNDTMNQVSVLETSGLLEAYEYFLKSICRDGLPKENVYEYAAQQILKYEKKHNKEMMKQMTQRYASENLSKAYFRSQSPEKRDSPLKDRDAKFNKTNTDKNINDKKETSKEKSKEKSVDKKPNDKGKQQPQTNKKKK